MADQSKNAGNIGDLVKHPLLPEIARILGEAFPDGWVYCETHAGFYDYSLSFLKKGDRWSGERAWSLGVLQRTGKGSNLGAYWKVLDACFKEGVYPGSIRIVNQALSEDKSLVGIYARDLGQDEVASYAGKSPRIHVSQGDGYRIAEVLPALPRLLFVDPFWTDPSEMAAVQEVLRRDASVIVWYPITRKTEEYRSWQREEKLSYVEIEFALHRGDSAWSTRDQKGAGLTLKGLPVEAVERTIETATVLQSIFAGQQHVSADNGMTRKLSLEVKFTTGERSP